MEEINNLSLEVQARETHEKVVGYFRATEQFAYKFFMEVKKIRDERYFQELGFSNFEGYCDTNFNLTSQYVNQKIQIADAWGENSETRVSELGHKKSLLLARLPEPEREEFIQSNPVDEMTTRELQQAIREKKEAEKQAEQLKQQLQREKNKPPQIIEKEIVKEVIPDTFKEKYLELEERAGNLDKAKMELSEYNRKKREIENEMSHLTDTMMDLREKYNEENANSEKQARLITKVRMAIKPIKQAEGEIKQLLRETRELSVAGKSELLSESETLFEIAEAIKKKANEIETEVIFYG